MQNVCYACLCARHTAVCARCFACGCGRGAGPAMFRYYKYPRRSHSCCRDPVSPPSVAKVNAPVCAKQLLADIFWIDLRNLLTYLFLLLNNTKETAALSPLGPAPSSDPLRHLFSAFVLFVRSHMWGFKSCLGWGNWFNMYENVLSLGKYLTSKPKVPPVQNPNS